MDILQHPPINPHSKKALQFVYVFLSFSLQCLRIQTFFVSYLEDHCIEVPLKQSFSLMRPKKLIPLSESSKYPGSQLSKAFWSNLVRKFKEPRNSIPVSKSPTYPGSHVTWVYCNDFQPLTTFAKRFFHPRCLTGFWIRLCWPHH